jgi:hypothetical protein
MQPDLTGGVEETKHATSSSSRSGTSSGQDFIPDESSSSGVDSSPAITSRSRAALTIDTGTEETDIPPTTGEESEQEDGLEPQIQDPNNDTIVQTLEETIKEETIEFEHTTEEEFFDPLNTSAEELVAELTGLIGTPIPPQLQEEDYIFAENPLHEDQEIPPPGQEEEEVLQEETPGNPDNLLAEDLLADLSRVVGANPQPPQP